MKKIVTTLATLMLICCTLTGCGHGHDVETEERSQRASKYFDIYIIYEDTNGSKIVYDKNTSVMYYMQQSGYLFGITPIYNSDGTVKLYTPELDLEVEAE